MERIKSINKSMFFQISGAIQSQATLFHPQKKAQDATFHTLARDQGLTQQNSTPLRLGSAASWAYKTSGLFQQLPLSILDGSVYHIIQASALVILWRHVKDAIIPHKIFDSLQSITHFYRIT
jgi:hypothetical protein